MNMDGDLGRHLTIGNYILEVGSIPIRDVFSHTMHGLPLTPHEWLAQVILASSYRIGGLDGVVFTCALLIAAIFTLVYRQCLRQSKMLLISEWRKGITVVEPGRHALDIIDKPFRK